MGDILNRHHSKSKATDRCFTALPLIMVWPYLQKSVHWNCGALSFWRIGSVLLQALSKYKTLHVHAKWSQTAKEEMHYRGFVSDKSAALSDALLTSRCSLPLNSHSLWKLNSLFLLVGERALCTNCLVLSGRKKAKRSERITEPAPNRNGAPDTIVWKSKTHHVQNKF